VKNTKSATTAYSSATATTTSRPSKTTTVSRSTAMPVWLNSIYLRLK
jgi:hypothetical protein